MSWQIILQILFVILCTVITIAETSLNLLSDTQLEKIIQNNNKKTKYLKKLTDNSNKYILSSQTIIKILEFVSAGISSVTFYKKFSSIFFNIFSERTSEIISVTIIMFIMVFIFVTLGEFIPKCIATKNPEKFALKLSGIIYILTLILTPVTWVMNIFSNGIIKAFGVNPEFTEETVTEKEILMMSDAGAEMGAIDEVENRIIKNVFAFDDMTAGQICTHRTEVSVLWLEDDVSVWETVIHGTRHSVFPVCGESIDNVVGILDAKDYFRINEPTHQNIMKNAVHEAFFVHENMKADKLFAHMKKNTDDHFAIVVDEYGGMSGIITITDLVEKIVGEFSDDDDGFEKIIKTGICTWTVQGMSAVGDVCDILQIELPADKNETFSGYIISELGDIPKINEKIHIDSIGLNIEILRIKHHRIELCRITKSENIKTLQLNSCLQDI